MYPNPQDVVPLPDRANLEQYKKHAKDLVKAYRSVGPDAIRDWASRWPGQAGDIERFAVKTLADRDGVLTAAQFVLARVHGFVSWPAFAAHLDDLAGAASPVSHFEAAADAIVAGDATTLAALLREHPELIRARSTREHRSTLLHYTAANGVENYRQQTPANIVEITKLLLDAGAEVDAEADIYGGGCTTLGLVATSVHPEVAGVQNALMQLLIDRGAAIDYPRGTGGTHSFVAGCLANGRPAAAEYLAARGARLDLDGAAGLGRLDLVSGFLNADGTLEPPATTGQLRAGMWWACEHGRTEVVRFLLSTGVLVTAPAAANGRTFLHAAAVGGRADVVELLVEHGVPIDGVEREYGGTPLTWALYGWSRAPAGAARDRYYDAVARLIQAGAPVDPAWLDDDAGHTPFAQQLRADPRMLAAVRGEMRPVT